MAIKEKEKTDPQAKSPAGTASARSEGITPPREETGQKADADLRRKRDELLTPKAKPKPPPATPPISTSGEQVPGPPPARGRGRPAGTTKKGISAKDVKRQIPEQEVQGWLALTTTFGAVLGIACNAIWPQKPVTAADEAQVSRAWAVYFTVCPPESLEDLAKLNLVCIHLVILLPRLAISFQAWMDRRNKSLHNQPGDPGSKASGQVAGNSKIIDVESEQKNKEPSDPGKPAGQGSQIKA